MTLPLVVRLHDDVELGSLIVRAGRVLRLSEAARSMLVARELVADSAATTVLAGRLLDLDLALPVPGSAASAELADLTVVVPVRDRPDEVARLLGALAGAVLCVVVDDASRDAEALREVVDVEGVELVRLDFNVGPAGARNVGLAHVTTPYVAFVDSDVELTGVDLRRLLAEFADPSLAAVAPRVRTRNGRRWFERYEDSCGSLDLGSSPAPVRPWSTVTYVPSACLVARVDALGPGFEESLVSGEDVDLVWRLIADGRRVRYAAAVQVWHDHRTTVSGWLGRKFVYGTSAAPLARRHGSQVAPAILSAGAAGFVVAAVAQRWWSWAAAGAIVAGSFGRTSSSLPELDRRERARVTTFAVSVTARQASALAFRHWWPLTLVLMPFSARLRRAIAAAAVIDACVAHRRSRTDLDLARFSVARRAGDLAFGAGVWWGAARARSIRCLLPAWSGRVVAKRVGRS